MFLVREDSRGSASPIHHRGSGLVCCLISRWRNGGWLLVRRLMAGLGVGLLPSACGGGSLTLTEYVDRLNAVNDLVVPQAAALISDLEQATTPGEAGAVMEQMAALRVESLEATEALEPPQSIADLHQLFMGWEKRLVPIELSFASRAEVVSGWEEFFESGAIAAQQVRARAGQVACEAIELLEVDGHYRLAVGG